MLATQVQATGLTLSLSPRYVSVMTTYSTINLLSVYRDRLLDVSINPLQEIYRFQRSGMKHSHKKATR